MGHTTKPPSVMDARRRRDSRALSALGRAGGLAKHDNRLVSEAKDELAAERTSAAQYARQVAANEHIVPLSTYE